MSLQSRIFCKLPYLKQSPKKPKVLTTQKPKILCPEGTRQPSLGRSPREKNHARVKSHRFGNHARVKPHRFGNYARMKSHRKYDEYIYFTWARFT